MAGRARWWLAGRSVTPTVAERERDDLAAKFDARGKQFADMFSQLNQANMELDRVRAERDEARAGLSNALYCFDDLASVAGRKYQELESERDLARAELASARTELDAVRAARDTLDRDLAEAIVERDDALALVASVARSNWVVARDDGYTCERCHHGIRRGEAYELLDGADRYRHIHCRTTEEPTDG